MTSAIMVGSRGLTAALVLTFVCGAAFAAVPDYNALEFDLVTEPDERGRLITNTPQWVVQMLQWPGDGEIEAHLGIRDEAQAEQATEILTQILRPDYVPAGVNDHWVPMRDWHIFYTDWIDHGGADAFLMNYEVDGIRIQVADSPNFVIIGARPVRGRAGRIRPEAWAVQVTEALCNEEIHPEDLDDDRRFRLIEIFEPDAIVEGDWVPRGPEGRRSSIPTSASVDIERVKFFTNGNIVCISVPKFLWDPGSLVNPFAERFPVPSGPAEIAAISQMLFRAPSPTPEPVASDPSRMAGLIEDLLRTTPSDVLLHDWTRRMAGVDLEQTRIERLFDDLSDEQRGLWHAQQLAQRVMAEGVRALSQGRLEEAATRFIHVLVLDPHNVSGNMLLQITRDRAQAWAIENEQQLPLPWFEAADQALRRHRTAVDERRIQIQQRSQRVLALRDLRTQWLEAYAENDLRRARQILQRMLEVDPGNASTLFFVDLIERLIAIEEGELN